MTPEEFLDVPSRNTAASVLARMGITGALSEPDMRKAFVFSPAEQAQARATETSAATRAELEAAIAAERNPAGRAALQDTLARDFGASAPAKDWRDAFLDAPTPSAGDWRDSFLDEPTPSGFVDRSVDYVRRGINAIGKTFERPRTAVPEQAPLDRPFNERVRGYVQQGFTPDVARFAAQKDVQEGADFSTPSRPLTGHTASKFEKELARGFAGAANSLDGIAMSEIADVLEAKRRGRSAEELASDPEYQRDVQAYQRRVANMQERARLMSALPRSSAVRKMFDGEGAEAVDNFVNAFKEDPSGAVSAIVGQSVPGSLSVVAAATIARFGNASMAGTAVAGGTASAVAEFGNNYAENRAKGMGNDEAFNRAAVKSGVVGLFDAASLGSASAALKEIGETGLRAAAKSFATEAGKQAVLGAGGETLGAVASGEMPHPGEVAAEAVGELIMGVGEGMPGSRARAPVAPDRPAETQPAQSKGSTAPVQASDVLGTPSAPTSAPGSVLSSPMIANQGADILTQPVQATALDRVNEIDRTLIESPDSPDVDALRAERAQLTRNWPPLSIGRPTTFATESGVQLDGQYAIASIDDLISSHDENLRPSAAFPQELQPRARDRAASELQVSNIVQKLNPARLGESPDVATGAPIIGADGLVESGNARTIAMKRVYGANGQKAQDYIEWLVQNAQRFGFAPDQVRAVDKPILVRVRNTPVDRAEFARQANAPTTAQMSPLEQAKSDAARIGSLEDFTVTDTGEFMTPANKRFIERFVGGLPVTEQSALVTGQGMLSQSGYARVRNAVLAKAYGNSSVLMRMVESLDSNLRNIMAALVRVAPAVAKAREAIKAGAMHDRDITEDVLGAVEELSRLRTEGTSVADYLAQTEMFGSKLTPEAAELLQFLDDNIRSPRKIATFIENYLSALAASGSPNQGSLLGETEAPSKRAIIQAAKERTSGEGQDAVSGSGRAAQEAGATGEVRPGRESEGSRAPRGQPGAASAGQPADTQTGGAGNQSVVGDGWALFPEESGTLGIPRAEMPQIKGEHRGALIQFLAARGIESVTRDISAADLRPTQAEYSPSKVAKWAEVKPGVDRSVLVSRDGYILDGHHQWVWARDAGEQVKAIVFSAPIKDLLNDVYKFPSVQRSDGADILALRQSAREDIKAALADLGAMASRHTRAAMLPEDTPGLMATLVKLFDAAIREVGYDAKALVAYVKKALKADPQFKAFWNKISDTTYRKAAQQALEQSRPADDLFASLDVRPGSTVDLFSAPQKPAVATISGRPYDMKRDNFVAPHINTFLTPEVIAQAEDYVEKYHKNRAVPDISKEDTARAEALLKPLLEKAGSVKPEYDQMIIDIARKSGALGQMIAPLKSMARAVQKLVLEEAFNVDGMKDTLRATIVVSSYADAQAVLDEITKNFELLRKPKNRTGNTPLTYKGFVIQPEDPAKFGGYSDVMVNVRMPNGVIAEIQINVPEMLGAKEGPDHMAPGHKLYEAYRDAPKESPLGQEILRAMLGYYAAAFEAASSRSNFTSSKKSASDRSYHSDMGPRESIAGLGESESPSSDSLNQPSAGNSTKNPPSTRSANREPLGNESGTFMPGSVPQSNAGAYNNGSEKSIGGGNAPVSGNRSPSPEGQVARTAQGADGKRGTRRVRDRTSVGDLFGDQPGDAASPGDAGLGQTQSDRDGAPVERGEGDVRGAGAGGNAGVPDGRRVIRAKSGANYQFTDADLSYEGSWYQKAVQNVEAIELVKRIESEGRKATPEEQSKLARYIGFGASDIRNALFPAKGREWSQEARWKALLERLESTLDAEEMATLRRSTQYAHYTSRPIVRSIWRAFERMGFQGGSILEPGAGIGIFPGLMPAEMAGASTYTGIEFDKLTGAILKQLMPDERILVESYVDSTVPKGFYDIGVGNPPFANTPILSDTAYKRYAFPLHDYFFAKSIDAIKPGGLMVFVSSHYTLDKGGEKLRSYIAKRADLVGAIRLPQTAFMKNAGTEVVTDVIIFRKRLEGEQPSGPAWLKLQKVKTAEGDALINEYFVSHPEMVLGTHSLQGTMYRDNEYTVLPKEGDIEAHFARAVERLPENIFNPVSGSPAEQAQVQHFDFNPKAQKEGNYYVADNGTLMVRQNGLGVAVPVKKGITGKGIPGKHVEIIKDFVALRDALKQAHYDQLNDGDWEQSLAALQKEYKKFVKAHGRVNQFKILERIDKAGETQQSRRYPLLEVIDDDPDYTRVMALEKVNEETGAIGESAFLTGRVLNKPKRREVRTISDALLAVLNERGRVDVDEMASMMNVSRAEVIDALGASIYEDPSQGWQTSDEYLSGNVRTKLKVAQDAATHDRRFERNVEALLAVQPAPIRKEDINASLGMNWIPTEHYEQFLLETVGARVLVEYNEPTNGWSVHPISGYSTPEATSDWGTLKRSAHELLEHALTKRPIRITRIEGSGKDRKTVFDADATEAANQKLSKLKVEFMGWIWRDADRAMKLADLYNEKFNTHVPRAFDGRHLTLPGTSAKWKIHDHVKRGAWRIVQRGNTYLAHAVGSGKTFESIIGTQESKRLGLIQKPMFVVPNHMLQQFAREFQDLYPTAKLMVADEKQFHTDRRRQFVSRVAMSDLDGVVITHSAFKLLDIDPAFKKDLIEQQLDYFRAALEDAGGDPDRPGKNRNPKVRQIENQIERLEEKLKAALSSVGKDKNVLFNEMGVDFLVVDEAHEFRKLAFATAMQVKGVDSQGSDRALDLWMKTRWLEEQHPGRSLVMMSGTPITNTLAELYTTQRFMNPSALEEKGLTEFDAWAAMFGQESTELEPNAVGGYESVTRFSQFINVGELVQMFREFADVLTSSQLGEILVNGRPKVKDGTRKLVLVDPVPELTHYLKTELNQRLIDSRAWKPSFQEPYNPDPVIKIITDGRLAAIDMRFINPMLPDNPGSKLNQMIDGIIDVYKRGSAIEYMDREGKPEPIKGATQMVFSDVGFGEQAAANRGFDARAWLLKRLTEAGVPKEQIAFMSDYKKSEAKLRLFRDMNSGKVRILVGSSKNMGTGVNAQQRLLALHHLDTPWYPADLEQREGRIIRYGNKNQEVETYAYATRGGYDSTMWQIVARKQRFIEQALSGDTSVRTLEDISESSNYTMAAAMTAGDQRAIQLAGLQAEVQKLERLRNAHHDSQGKLERDLYWARRSFKTLEGVLPEQEEAAAKVQDLAGDKFRAKSGDATFKERKQWGESILAKFASLAGKVTDGEVKVGEVSGFDVVFYGRVQRDNNQQVVDYQAEVALKLPGHDGVLALRLDADPVGVAMRAVNAIESVRVEPGRTREKIAEASARIQSIEPRIGAPFEFQEVLRDKISEMHQLETELAKGDAPDPDQPRSVSMSYEGGLSTAEAEAVVLPLVDGIKNLAPGGVKVVERADEMPPRIRDALLSQNAMDDTEGLFDPDTGTVWLIARNIDSQARAQWVLWHELYGHYGLRGMYGDELNDVLGNLWARNANVRREASKLNARFGYTHYLAIEEALAGLAGEGKKFTGLHRLVRAIQEAMRKRGWNRAAEWLETLTNAEVLDVLASAKRFVVEGEKAPHTYSPATAPAFSRIRGVQDEHIEKDSTATAIKPGDRFLVYRVGTSPGLANRNAGNAESVARHLMAFDDFDAPAGRSIGDTVYVYEVVLGEPFGEYTGLRNRETKGGNAVGRSTRSLEVAYSFPEGGAWEAHEVGRVPLADVRARFERGGYEGFDQAGTIVGGRLIRETAFAAMNGPLFSRASTAAPAQPKPSRGFAPLEATTKLAVKLTGIDKATGWAYDKLLLTLNRVVPEKIKAGVVSDYGIPEAVQDQRAAMQGRLRKGFRQVESVLDKLSGLTRAESRVAYEWANADDPQAADWFREQLPPESIATLAEVEQTIDKLSEEAVRLGQLSPEVRERNRFAYLRRSYVKHTAELTEQEKVSRRKAVSVLGEQYKGRGMVDGAPMRQVQNVAPEWWQRKLQAGKADKAMKGEKLIRFERRATVVPGAPGLPGIGSAQPQKRRLLEIQYWPASEPVPARYGAWEEAGTWEVRDVKGDELVLWRDFTAQEREAMGEIDEVKYAVAKTLHAMIHDIEVGKYLEWLAGTEGKTVAPAGAKVVEASESLTRSFGADEWVQVPDSSIQGTGGVKRYGKLAGKYIPAPIWNDVRQVVNFRFQPLGEMYSQILRAWKISKTALSPAVHMNNVMANWVMADWHDVGARHLVKALDTVIGAKKDPKKQATIDAFEDAGGAIGSYSLSELQREQLEPLLEELRKEVGLANQTTHMVGISAALHLMFHGKLRESMAAAGASKTSAVAAKAATAMIDLYQAEDVVFRLAAFIKAREEGLSDLAAAKIARKSFLDYSINAPWIQMMRNTAFPFISFTYRAAPMLLEVAAKKPWKLLKLGLVYGALNALGYAISGGDEDKERKLLPEEKAGKIFGFVVPKLIRMPWNDDHGSPVFLDIRRWIPVGDIFDLGQSHGAIPILPFMVPGGPLAVMAELVFNKSQFTGKEIVKDTDTAGEVAKNVADHLFKAFAPNIPGLPGTYSTTGLWNAAAGKTDAFGRELSTAQAATSAIGVKLGSYPPDVLMKNLVAKRDAELRQIGERQAALRREYVRKGINAEEFEAKMGAQIKKREKVQREFAERVR